MTPPKLLLYCTCDRFNYGDLLFPLITRAALTEYLPDLRCVTYGVAARDMRVFGADQAGSVAELLGDASAGDLVVIAGGEVLAQSWLDTYLTLTTASEVDPLLQLCAREVVRRHAGYICFQANPHYGAAHRMALREQLSDLHRRTGRPILLLPIARMTGYDDREFLATLDLDSWAYQVSEANTVQEIAYVLSRADLYVGTSLHGVITALSYEVPVLGLATGDPKLGFYHESWLPGYGTVPPGALAVVADARLREPRDPVRQLSRRLRQHAWRTIGSLVQQIAPGSVNHGRRPASSQVTYRTSDQARIQ